MQRLGGHRQFLQQSTPGRFDNGRFLGAARVHIHVRETRLANGLVAAIARRATREATRSQRLEVPHPCPGRIDQNHRIRIEQTCGAPRPQQVVNDALSLCGHVTFAAQAHEGRKIETVVRVERDGLEQSPLRRVTLGGQRIRSGLHGKQSAILEVRLGQIGSDCGRFFQLGQCGDRVTGGDQGERSIDVQARAVAARRYILRLQRCEGNSPWNEDEDEKGDEPTSHGDPK